MSKYGIFSQQKELLDYLRAMRAYRAGELEEFISWSELVGEYLEEESDDSQSVHSV